MRKLRLLALALAVGSVACHSTTSVTSELLTVAADGSALTLKNPNPWPVFYIAADPGFLALADYALCVNPESNCPRVAARSTVRVPYSDIAGYNAASKDVVIMQWRLQRELSGSYTAIDFSSLQLRLP
jgi:hypothetical protein